MTTVREQVRAALSHCAEAYRDADALSALAALDAEDAERLLRDINRRLLERSDTKGEEK